MSTRLMQIKRNTSLRKVSLTFYFWTLTFETAITNRRKNKYLYVYAFQHEWKIYNFEKKKYYCLSANNKFTEIRVKN